MRVAKGLGAVAREGLVDHKRQGTLKKGQIFVRVSLSDQSKRPSQLVVATRPAPRHARCDAVEPRRSRATSTIERHARREERTNS